MKFQEQYVIGFYESSYRIVLWRLGSAIGILFSIERIIHVLLWKKYKNWLGERIQE
jgi:hypothetical protein